MVAEASANKWSIGTDDVKNAFLAAPLPAGRGYAMEPPRAAIRAGLAEEGELWVVDAAVYGFKKSPKWWTDHRNSKARLAKWKDDDGKPVKLEGCLTDVNLYKVLKEEKPGTWTLTGLVVFYVDDVLAAGPDSILRGFFGWLGSQWETNGCEMVERGNHLSGFWAWRLACWTMGPTVWVSRATFRSWFEAGKSSPSASCQWRGKSQKGALRMSRIRAW